jgi:hypothetical protein
VSRQGGLEPCRRSRWAGNLEPLTLGVKVANANVDTGTSVIFLHLLSLINPDFSLHHMLRTISAEFLLPLEGFFHDPTIFQNQIDVIPINTHA